MIIEPAAASPSGDPFRSIGASPGQGRSSKDQVDSLWRGEGTCLCLTKEEGIVLTIIQSGSKAWAVAATNGDVRIFSREQVGEWVELLLSEDSEQLDGDGSLILEALYEQRAGREPEGEGEEPEAEEAEEESEAAEEEEEPEAEEEEEPEPEEEEEEPEAEEEEEPEAEEEEEEEKPRRRRSRTRAKKK